MDDPIAKSFGTFDVKYLKYIPVDSYENPITPGPPNLTISPHRFQTENDAYPDDSGPTPADPVIYEHGY